MSYIKLIKLLYILDREALATWGWPVTTDCYVSMNNGPVVSRIYDLITDERIPGEPSIWENHISKPENYEVELLRAADLGELSEAEEKLIRDVFDKYGRLGRWEVVQICHDFPEYVYPEGSAIPIDYRDILEAFGKTPTEIAKIENRFKFINHSQLIFDPR